MKRRTRNVMRRPTVAPHHGQVQVGVSFDAAYARIQAQPDTTYVTAAQTPFTAVAATVQRGQRRGQRVIIFRRGRSESARAYEDCWGHVTNANRTYIDSYTQAVGLALGD